MKQASVGSVKEGCVSYTPNTRFDIYKVMHKYIRGEINHIAEQCGNTDFMDADERIAFKVKFDTLFELLASHAENEDAYINPLLAEMNSSYAAMIEADHAKMEQLSSVLKKDLECLLSKDVLTEVELNHFYLSIIQFQSLYFNHLHDEETKINQALQEGFSDEKLYRASGEMLKHMPADRMIEVTKGMLGKINHQERLAIYAEMQKSMPADVFQQMCKLAQAALSSEQSQKLFNALECC